MVLVDVIILIGAKMSGLPFHAQAKAWLDALLQSDQAGGVAVGGARGVRADNDQSPRDD